jgi:hypothetical protein
VPKWTIRETIEYCADGIEAESEEEAMRLFILNLESYYCGVSVSEIEKMEDEEDDQEAEQVHQVV